MYTTRMSGYSLRDYEDMSKFKRKHRVPWEKWSPEPLFKKDPDLAAKEFATLFLDWFHAFIVEEGELDFTFSKKHHEFIRWFGELLFGEELFITKVCATQRMWGKTLLVKAFIIYLLLHREEIKQGRPAIDPHYIMYLSNANKKVKEEFRGIRKHLTGPRITSVYGERLNTTPKSGTTTTDFHMKNGCLLEGSTQTLVRKGITHLDVKARWLFTDDIETTRTQYSPATTEAIWHFMQADAIASMHVNRRRIMHITNYTARTGNQQKLLDGVDDKDKMVVGLYDENGNITWPERYVETEEEAKKTGKQSIEQLRKWMEKQSGSSRVFVTEMLCDPEDEGLLTHRIDVIRGHCEPKEPLNAEEVSHDRVSFNIYKEPDIDGGIFYTGVDLSLGVGKDACAFVIVQNKKGVSEIIADGIANDVGQDVFAVSMINAFRRLRINPIVIFDALGGGMFEHEIKNLYNVNMLYRDERGNLGYRTTSANKSVLVNGLRSMLENGDLLNHSERLDRELATHTAEDAARSRINPLTDTRHFDLISAAQLAAISMGDERPRDGLEEQGFFDRGMTELDLATNPMYRNDRLPNSRPSGNWEYPLSPELY